MKIKLELDINNCLECPFMAMDWVNGGKCRWDGNCDVSVTTVPTSCDLLVKEDEDSGDGHNEDVVL